MKIILNDSVPHLGEAGDEVEVAPGYARNYLVPRNLAFEATPANIKTYETNLKQRARKIAKVIKAAVEQKARLEEAGDLVFTRKAGDEGKLFGSVTSADIHRMIEEKGFDIDRRKIVLDHPIKHLGEVNVNVKIHPKVTAVVKVVMQPEVTEEPPAESEAPEEPPAESETAEGTDATEAAETPPTAEENAAE